MPNIDSQHHVVKTSSQWNERAVEFWVVPRGCLCVELTPEKKTKIKVGEGNKFFSQLPYICSEADLSNYYTKEEIDNIMNNFNRMAIMSTNEYDSKNDLPMTGNKLGDVRFVKSSSPSIKIDPDVYLWNGVKWIYVGSEFPEIDLRDYLKKEEFHELFDPVKFQVDEMYPMRHTHTNKDVLDQTTAPYTIPEKDKLAGLENYDDTELRNRVSVVESEAHTHSNKTVLDQVTQQVINNVHTHMNKTVLDQTTANYTIEEKEKLASLEPYEDFVGATPTEDGEHGLVPAPTAGEQSYYLRGDGTWAKIKQGGDKYKAGDGIYILAGDASSTTLPVEIYAKANKLKQYVLYGGTDPVGDWDSTLSKYAVVIKVSAEGMSDISTSLFLDDPIGNGDYIDYANQQFVHTRTNMTFGVRSGEWDRWIHADGTTTGEYTHQDSMAPSDYIAVSSEYVYLYYPGNMHGCDQFGIPCYAALYDENKVFTRSILLRSFTEVTIEPQPGEVYLRVSFGYYQGSWYRLTKIGEVITPIILPPVIIYTNKVNTIDVMTANKPTEVYFETAVVEDTSEDPMSEYTGIIYNEGVLDITQEDPNALNELTVHFRESDKVITVPEGNTYTAGDGIGIDANNEISAKLGSGLQFDANGAIEAPGSKTYVAGDGIVINDNTSFELSEDTVTNTDYFFDTQVTSNVSGRTFTKYNTEPALGAIVCASSYSQPYFVGLTADSVKYGTDYNSQIWPNPDHPTFEYKGVTWYYSGFEYAMPGDRIDSSGHMQKLSGSYSVSTEADLQNIARAIIDAADIIMSPAKAISAKIGEGLEVDSNNDINVKIGDGLYFDADGAIAASGDNDYTAGEGIDIIGTTRPIDINYIRLDINNSRDNGRGGIIQFKNIRVLDTNGSSLQFSHASSIYGDGSAVEYGQNSRDESPQAMIEGRNKTCCTNFSLTKAPLKITFTLTSEISIANITSFSILTGADNTARDPVSWDIYASNDGVTWYKIQEAHSPDVTTARSTWITDIPFVIPPDAVEVLPGVKTINAKIGNGLSFDNNDSITVDEMTGASALSNGASGTVPAPIIGDETKFLRGDGTWANVESDVEYTAGDAISIDDSTAPLTATLTHFKWEISQTRAKAAGTVYVTLQVSEIEFYDENDQLITFSAIAGSFKSDSPNPPSPSYATTPTVQTPDKIIDNDITTKCCVTNFTSELDAMVFIFELDSTNPITAQDIKRYRYYTADDDTSADPVTWTLSVSADGIEWFVVDTQTEFNVPTARETSTDYFTMTKPTIPAKSINVKYNDGLMLDANGNLVVQTGQGIEISNNAVTAKLGVGLTFDNIDAITLDETTDLVFNCDYSE